MKADSIETVLALVLKNFVMERHLKIALSKMAHQQEDTFKFITEDGRLEWVNDIEPTFTSPRLSSALYFLQDLKLITVSPCAILSMGKDVLRENLHAD
jgi:hypothetical protein